MNLAGTPPYNEKDSINFFFKTAPAPNTDCEGNTAPGKIIERVPTKQ